MTDDENIDGKTDSLGLILAIFAGIGVLLVSIIICGTIYYYIKTKKCESQIELELPRAATNLEEMNSSIIIDKEDSLGDLNPNINKNNIINNDIDSNGNYYKYTSGAITTTLTATTTDIIYDKPNGNNKNDTTTAAGNTDDDGGLQEFQESQELHFHVQQKTLSKSTEMSDIDNDSNEQLYENDDDLYHQTHGEDTNGGYPDGELILDTPSKDIDNKHDDNDDNINIDTNFSDNVKNDDIDMYELKKGGLGHKATGRKIVGNITKRVRLTKRGRANTASTARSNNIKYNDNDNMIMNPRDKKQVGETSGRDIVDHDHDNVQADRDDDKDEDKDKDTDDIMSTSIDENHEVHVEGSSIYDSWTVEMVNQWLKEKLKNAKFDDDIIDAFLNEWEKENITGTVLKLFQKDEQTLQEVYQDIKSSQNVQGVRAIWVVVKNEISLL